MLSDSNFGYTAPDFRPALACVTCNPCLTDPAEHDGWTSRCLGRGGDQLTCQRGDQVCMDCPSGSYIGEGPTVLLVPVIFAAV